MFGQDPIKVPYVVDVTPCRLQTLTVPTQPPDLIISRTSTAGHLNTYDVNPSYLSKLVSSNPSGCPVLNLELLDTSNVALNNPRVRMLNTRSPTTAQITVQNDVAFSLTVRIKGYTLITNAYMSLNIRVCGAETLSLVDATKKFYINGVETGDTGSMSDT